MTATAQFERTGTTTIRTERVEQHPEVTRVTQEHIIQAVLAETAAATPPVPCDRQKAQQVYGLIQRAVRRTRKWKYAPYHVTQDELDRLHAVLEVIMPDEVTEPKAGSAHDGLNRHFLHGSEFSLVHTKDARRGSVYCAVAIEALTI